MPGGVGAIVFDDTEGMIPIDNHGDIEYNYIIVN